MERRRCGRTRRPGAAHPQGAFEPGPFRVLVAGRQAAGDGEYGWNGEGVGRSAAAGSCSPSGAIRARSVPCPGRRTGNGWRQGVWMGRRRCGRWPAAGSTAHAQRACEPARCRVLVAGRDAAGDGGWGWDGQGVGRGRRPGTAHPSTGIRTDVHSVSWSPDGKRLATGSRGWNGQGVGRSRRPGAAHPQGAYAADVRSVSWSPDGKSLATGSEDGTAKVWDAAERPRSCSPSRGIRAGLLSVSWSPDGDGWRRGVGMGRRRCGRRPAGTAPVQPSRTAYAQQ